MKGGEVFQVIDTAEDSRNLIAGPALPVPPIHCDRRLQTTNAAWHRPTIVGDAADCPSTGAIVPEQPGLVLSDVRVVQLEAHERRRRCRVVSAILLRLAARDGTWAQDEAA